jgi:hypothetical protein
MYQSHELDQAFRTVRISGRDVEVTNEQWCMGLRLARMLLVALQGQTARWRPSHWVCVQAVSIIDGALERRGCV